MNDELEDAFELLCAQGLRAVEWGRLDQLGAVLDSLIEPMEVGLQTLGEYGLSFDPDSAQQVFPFEWRALEKPFDVFERITDAAARSSDGEVIRDVAFWPFRVMDLAVERNDHFFFQRATRSYIRFYYLSERDATPTAKDNLRKLSWRHLKEFSSFRLTPKLRAADSEELARLAPYMEGLLQTFAELLRAAIDNADSDYWDDGARGFWQALDIGFITGNQDPEVQLSLSRHPLGADSQAAQVLVGLIDVQYSLWLNLGAWAAGKRLSAGIPSHVAERILTQIAGPFTDFRRLWQTYNFALSSRREKSFPLPRWEMALHPEGEVVGINAENLLTQLFVALVLSVAPPVSFDTLRATRRPAQALWLHGLVEQALSEVESKQDDWSQMLGTLDLKRRAPLTDLVEAAVAYERQAEQQRIIDQNLSAESLDEFRTAFLEGWATTGLFRWLFQAHGLFRAAGEDPPRDSLLRIWKLEPKGYFVEDTGSTHYAGLGQNFGSGFARGEDTRIYSALLRGATRYRQGKKQLHRRLAEVIKGMRIKGYPPDVIVAVAGWDTTQHLHGSAEWQPSYALSQSYPASLAGFFDAIPVHNFYPETERTNGLLILSMAGQVAHLRQYVGSDHSFFTVFRLRSFSRESTPSGLEQDDSWLPQEMRELPRDELLQRLLESVDIRIEEGFDIDIQNAGARAILSLSSQTAAGQEVEPVDATVTDNRKLDS